jgi:hypothetical protein
MARSSVMDAPADYQQDSDDLPEWVHDPDLTIESYTQHVVEEAGARIGQMLAERRTYERVESAEARVRELHDGKDGLPPYSELVDQYAVPFLRQQPVALRQLVLQQSNPAEAAYLIGFCCRYPELIPQVAARKGKLDKTILQSINFRPTVGQGSERRQPSGKVNYENWNNDDFLAELERFKNEQ